MTDEHGPFDANDPAHRLYNHAEVAAREAAAELRGRRDGCTLLPELPLEALPPPDGSDALAAREAAAAQAMREALITALNERAATLFEKINARLDGAEHRAWDRRTAMLLAYASTYQCAADKARALPLPAPDALARIRAEARREGMEAAAAIAERAIPAANPPRSDGYGHHVAGERFAAKSIAAAIRAMAEEAPHE